MKNSQMINSFVCGRRKFHWILFYFMLACLCWVVIHFFIQYKGNTIHRDIQVEKTQQNEPEINIAPVNSDSDYYVAAVVDYEVVKLTSALASLWTNLQFIIDAIVECSKNQVDIVVFPEGSVYGYSFYSVSRPILLLVSTYVPSSSDFIVPCIHKDYEMVSIFVRKINDEKMTFQSYLRQLSCAAKANKIYVAVNVLEKAPSSKSTAWDGLLLYNTEVVFDRSGMIVARYRKFNLYLERWLYDMSNTDEAELITFTTDFGVKFGIFTCFDILFTAPALELVTKHNITHFIQSSQIMTKLPFLTASTFNFGWSYASDVVVLTSSGPYPTYTKGTNIYFGRRLGTRTYIKPFRTSNIIIAPVPKKPYHDTPEYPKEYKSLKEYIPNKIRQSWFLVDHIFYNQIMTKPLITGQENSAIFRYKKATFECVITASWESLGLLPNYKFVAYSGPNNYSVSSMNNYIEICGIALCSPFSAHSSCQQPPRFEDASKLNFLSINISTSSTVLDSIRVPTAADSDLVALDATNFHFASRTEDSFGDMVNRAHMMLKQPNVNLLAFGIYKFPSKATPIVNYNHYDNMINADMIM